MSRLLETPRLRLVPLSERHVTPRYVSWLNDPDVVRFSEQRHRQHTSESVADYVRSFAGTPHHLWAIERRDGAPDHIGNISAYIDGQNSVGDVGILIGEKSCWGHGYGAEAWNAVCRFLLDDLKLRKVTGGTASANVGMLAIMRRVGMQNDGTRAKHLTIDGRELDLIHMALFRNIRDSGPR